MFIRIVLSLILGLLSSILVLERDPEFKQVLGNYCIAMFESAMHCHMKCKIARIDLFRRTIELDDVDVSPKEQNIDDWRWTCKHYQIKISPWAFLTRRVISMSMWLEGIDARSKLENNSLKIMPHLQLLISFSAVAALELKSLSLRRVRLAANDELQGHHIDIGFNSDSNVLTDAFKIVFYWTHGAISFAHRDLFSDLQGSIELQIKSGCCDLKDSVTAHVDCSCIVPQLPDKARRCFIGGNYEHSTVTLQVKSANDLFNIGPVKAKLIEGGVVAGGSLSLPVSYLCAHVYNTEKRPAFDGSCMAKFQVAYNNKGLLLKGSCGVRDLFFGTTKIASLATTTFSHAGNMWQGHLEYKRDELAIDGTWHWNQDTHKGSAELDNSSHLRVDMFPHLSIDPHAVTLKTTFDDQFKINGQYKAIVSHSKTDKQNTIAGSIQADKQGVCINGLYNNYTYALSGSYSPDIRLQKLILKNEKNEPLIEIHGKGQACQGSIDLSTVRPVIKNFTNIDIQGEGVFKLHGAMQQGLLIVKTKLDLGTIRIPQTYMCVTGLDSSISVDFARKALMINYARVKLYEGSVVCRRATALFDDSLHLSYAQIPLLINDCLFNVRKDLFGVLSGNILVTKDVGALPYIKGSVFIDKAQLTETLFSGVLHDAALKSAQGLKAANSVDSLCDLELLTYNPIRVNTPFLDGQARMNMHIKGHITDPAIAGSVAFESGKLLFPYRPLNIAKANITLSPGSTTDPLIDIVAKNRVKKYMISLQVAGSLQSHQIVLSSTPSLSNEQILGLLLVGSEEESLGSMVPALVMQNIKPLVFGSEWPTFIEKYFNVLLKPLQYVHFVPSFGNQTGRGGLRGTLEIDLNDRWRAMVQNNFNLSEDTRFEVEYMLSDDISLKGARDEHRDITGEVEMRWKFR